MNLERCGGVQWDEDGEGDRKREIERKRERRREIGAENDEGKEPRH